VDGFADALNRVGSMRNTRDGEWWLTVRGRTLSREQRDYAVKRIMDACLSG